MKEQVFIEVAGGRSVQWDGVTYPLPTSRTRVEDAFRDAHGDLVEPVLAHHLAGHAAKTLNVGENVGDKAVVKLTIDYAEGETPETPIEVQVASLSARVAAIEDLAAEALERRKAAAATQVPQA